MTQKSAIQLSFINAKPHLLFNKLEPEPGAYKRSLDLKISVIRGIFRVYSHYPVASAKTHIFKRINSQSCFSIIRMPDTFLVNIYTRGLSKQLYEFKW